MVNMRIGIDCHNLEGARTGVGRYLWNLLREWSKLSGFDSDSFGVKTRQAVPASRRLQSIEFVLYFKEEVTEDILDLSQRKTDSTGLPKTGWKIRNLGVSSNAIFKHWALPRAAAKDGVDVLFCPDYVLPIYTGGLHSHMKTALTLHDIIYEARPEEYSWPSWADKILLKWASRRSAKKADIIFTPSNFTKQEVIKYYNVNPNRIVVTPLAPDPVFKKIDFNDVNASHAGKEIRKKYNIKDRFIFFTGSIFNRRFIPRTLEAFEKFAESHQDFQFVIVGKNHTNPYENIGKKIADINKKFGREAIVWKDHTKSDKELVWLYNKAHITLWLSSYEGFGLPVLESMACGTPVITSPHGSLPEVAGNAALYVENPGKSEEIYNSLYKLVKDSILYGQFVDKGFERIKKFSWQKTAEDTLKNLM